jgi:hypothetical protein
MQTFTLTEIFRKPSKLREALKKSATGEVRIIWKQPKPNGSIEDSAIVKLERK